jgi:hypothetical protein
VDAAVEARPFQRLADAILAGKGEGYRTRRLDGALSGTLDAAQAAALVARFEEDVARLQEIEAEVRDLDPSAPEAAAPALRDPDRLVEARALLAAVRERLAPPPAPPPGGGLHTLTGESLALRAARAVAGNPGALYNPLYVLAADPDQGTRLLAALGNDLAAGAVVAFVDGLGFEAELIEAIAAGRVEAWRARYRRAGALIFDRLDAFAEGEGAHQELFHLFEDLHRRGGQVVCSAAVPPQQLPLPDRLRSRLESGLVVELDAALEPETPGSAAALERGVVGRCAARTGPLDAEPGEGAVGVAVPGGLLEEALD